MAEPAWPNRRLLLRGRERLSERALARMWNGCVEHDPPGQILTAWIAKEELRALCHRRQRRAPPRDLHPVVGVLLLVRRPDVPEITTLAETIATWWPAVEVFLTTGLTNARTEARIGSSSR